MKIYLAFVLVVASLAEKPSEEQHKMDFMAFDLNQDGMIDASEVRNQFEGNLKQQEVSAFFMAADKNQDGLITLEEYLRSSLRQENGDLDLNSFKF
jgi:Ca2+-binding EF-hand superfamily protein